MNLTITQQLMVFFCLFSIWVFERTAKIDNRFDAIYKDFEGDIAFGADNWFQVMMVRWRKMWVRVQKANSAQKGNSARKMRANEFTERKIKLKSGPWSGLIRWSMKRPIFFGESLTRHFNIFNIWNFWLHGRLHA